MVAASPQIIKKGRGWRRGLCRRVVKGKVLRMDRPRGRRVLKFDGAFGPEGCGIALSGDEYKVSVTGLAFCITWHDKHSVIGSLRSPPPIRAAPDFPLFRGQNKTPRNNLPINPPLEMTVLASSIQSFQKGTNDKNAAPHPRHFDRSRSAANRKASYCAG